VAVFACEQGRAAARRDVVGWEKVVGDQTSYGCDMPVAQQPPPPIQRRSMQHPIGPASPRAIGDTWHLRDSEFVSSHGFGMPQKRRVADDEK